MKRRTVILLVVVAAVLAVVGWVIHSYRSEAGRLVYAGTVETREIQIGSKIGGRVTEVAVEEGQAVKAGTPLVRFEAGELQAQRAQAQAQVVRVNIAMIGVPQVQVILYW